MMPPRPLISNTSRPFWDGLREERLELQRCADCTRWIFYPRRICPHCGGTSLAWQSCPATGTLHTYTIAAYPVSPDFADQPTQYPAIVELEIGVRLPTTLVVTDADTIRIGAQVAPVFDHTTFEDITLLRFRMTA